MLTTVDILRSLVSIPSVSSLSNVPLLHAVSDLLKPCGWSVEWIPYTAADGVQKANLLALPTRFRDALPEIDLLFVCHTDTVPYRGSWAEATTLTERDGVLHGCGSCDVKGSLAGLLGASLAVDVEQMQSSVAFAFTSEEEIGCIGATRLAASGVVRPRRVVVCEPTSLHPATAGKGYGLAQVTVRGQEAHSAFPIRGVSAITIAAELILKIYQLVGCGNSEPDGRFTPPHTTFNVGLLHGGTAKNIIAGECRFQVEWRPLPSEDPAAGGERVRQLAAKIEAAHSGCSIEVEALRADSGFMDDPSAGETFGATLSLLLARPQTGISFGSEATRFASLGAEVVVIGPGDMETAHSERECVPIVELNAWTELVKHLLLQGTTIFSNPREPLYADSLSS